ncbi:MAG: vWA domain-containing protein [Pseudomonadota bacterium]
MLSRRDRTISIFTLSALDLFAVAMGAFVLMALVLMPYYRKHFDAFERIDAVEASTQSLRAEAEQLRRAAEEDARAAEEALQSAAADRGGAEEALAAAASLRQEADAANKRADAPPPTPQPPQRVDRFEAETDRTVIPALDLAFVIDATGSMGGAIADLKANVAGLARVLERLAPSVRIGIVAYRDTDVRGWLTRPLPLTDVGRRGGLDRVVAFADALAPAEQALGGRTPNEAVLAGLDDALAFDWRSGARKAIVLIADAAAHRDERARTIAQARDFAAGADVSLSVLLVRTPSYDAFAIDDASYFRALAAAGRGGFFDNPRSMMESVLKSVLAD